MKILVTGGAGYIGSHTCVELLNSGYEVVVMDNLYNASAKALDRVQQITGKTLTFYEADMLDQPAMDKIFEAEKPDAVIHFAGYKAVGESVVKPIEYYHNNMTGTLLLCDTMRKHGFQFFCYSIWRSSGDPDHRRMPETESDQPLWSDQDYAGAGADGHPSCRSRVECNPASLFQSDRCTQVRTDR